MADNKEETGNLLDVSKGLHLDYSPIAQPFGTYRNLVNGIRGNDGSIQNEKGTIDIQFLGKTIIGGVILDRDLILFMVPSEIGILNKDDIYTTITDRDDLNYQLNESGRYFDVVANKKFKDHRVVYTVDGINPDRRIDLDDLESLRSTSFIEDTKIQVNPSIPEVTIDSVVDGGNLPTGVYMATARLLTKSTNAAPFGFVSPLVSIIDDAISPNYDQQDGANPQSASSKAINFLIKNIDPQYAFVQIVIATYKGTANITTANVVATLPIDGRTTIPFTYSSLSQNKENIDLTAISVKPVYYDFSKSIEQKDGILVRSNLRATQDDYDFQSFANLVKIRYVIEEIPWQPGYKDAIINALKRGYQRSEVYSFGIAPVFTTSYNTTGYHIPNTNSDEQANKITRELGQYQSLETYPDNKNYPSGNVKHHRMPSIAQEPLLINNGGVPVLRIVGIEVDFSQALDSLSPQILKNIKGFSIIRQTRHDNDKSILAQGIANPHIRQNAVNYNFLSAFPKGLYGNTGFFSSTTVLGDSIGFMSPETTIYNDLPIGLLKLNTVAELRGTQKIIHDYRNHDGDTPANTQIFLDYPQVYPLTDRYSDIDIQTNSPQYVPASSGNIIGPNQSNVLINGTNTTINNYKNNGYLFLKLSGTLPIKQDSYKPNSANAGVSTQPEFYYNYRKGATDLIFMNGVEKSDTNTVRMGDTNRYLYNITRALTRQYGSIYDAQYIICATAKLDNIVNSPVANSITCFGGDTFIGKFGVVNQMAFAGGDDEVQFKVLSYFFCESTINVDYRHYTNPVSSEGQPDFIPGTTPYYPKLNVLYNDPKDQSLTVGILNLSWTLGHGRGYNKQYSFDNTLITLYPKSLSEESITDFSNRSIYSDQSIEGEQLDAYRVFLPNNYHDISRDRGEIMDTFVHNNRFYIHTTGALYVSSFNDKEAMVTDKSSVYLGNGGVFNRPSEPIQTVNGGYAGTQGKWGLSTPFGYLFVDARQKKIFLLGDRLDDLSGQGLDTFFSSIEESDFFSLVYDYKEGINRFIISSSKGWTLSYQSKLKSWTGFHSYNPYYMISRGVDMYSIHSDTRTLLKMGVGEYGEYNGRYSPLDFRYVVNLSADTTKYFDNVVIHSTTTEEENFRPYETFTALQVSNNTKDTSPCEIIVPTNFQEEFAPKNINQVFAKKKNQEFRLAIPNNLLTNDSVPGDYKDTRAFNTRITGKWAYFDWTFNRPHRKFVLHTIKTKLRGVAR